MTSIISMDHDQYAALIKSTLSRMIIKSVMAALVKQAAFFAWGPVNGIIAFVVTKLVDFIINQTELAIFLEYTDMRVGQQGKAFTQAALENSAAQMNGTPEQRALAEKKLIDSFREFAKLKN